MRKALVAIAVIGAGLALGVSTAKAYRGDPGVKGPNFDPERHAQMEEVLNNQDYQGWLELMGDRPVTDKITEENFGRFVEMHQLRLAGDDEGAKQIREELGLGWGQGFRAGLRNGNCRAE